VENQMNRVGKITKRFINEDNYITYVMQDSERLEDSVCVIFIKADCINEELKYDRQYLKLKDLEKHYHNSTLFEYESEIVNGNRIVKDYQVFNGSHGEIGTDALLQIIMERHLVQDVLQIAGDNLLKTEYYKRFKDSEDY
jgi:hypothetical protein